MLPGVFACAASGGVSIGSASPRYRRAARQADPGRRTFVLRSGGITDPLGNRPASEAEVGSFLSQGQHTAKEAHANTSRPHKGPLGARTPLTFGSPRAMHDRELARLITSIHTDSRGTDRWPRMYAGLALRLGEAGET